MPAPYVPVLENPRGGRTFYLSPDGDDEADGRTLQTAWQTLRRVDAVRLKPGDRVLLRGGARFPGTLSIGQGDAGNARKPVVIESYGTGRAAIAAVGSHGIEVHNTSGIVIRNLVLTGNVKAFRKQDGISLVSDLPGRRKLPYVRVTGVDVSGFRNGIRMHGGPGGSGFRDVVLRDCTVHNNQEAGVVSDGPAFDATAPVYAHEDITVSKVTAFRNDGDPRAADRNTGSGIVLGSVRHGVVEDSDAHANGKSSSAQAAEGPEGIWTYDSTRMVLQRNVAYANRTGSRVDGGGFGLDNNVSHSLVQYNLSYDNDGAGFLAYSAVPNHAHTGNTIRYNISRDNARKLEDYGGIVALGSWVSNLAIYQNTVLATAHGSVRAPALRLQPNLDAVSVRNNVFATDGPPLVAAGGHFDTSEVAMQGNDYHAPKGWNLEWGDGRYTDLAAWRQASGQELQGPRATGTSADPCLTEVPVSTNGPGVGRTGTRRGALVTRCAQALAGAAVQLSTVGVDPGPVDYFGTPLTGSPAIGAVQPAPKA
ncbi:right-handed parallel beta-helix repeat-containing protein [Streptomyces sp. NK08204]|uniref:right-handed parallel beta-helix repeat-containing protein n=1 Tax=Streptomyces sp. NK08204 TaxID=2873260 RepID=UPI001CEDA52C|nr:right-handed parallel beta-helix repeat-containing protein [Streptomyces sp. NK08204]